MTARRLAEVLHWAVWVPVMAAVVVAALQGYYGAAFALAVFVMWVSACALLPWRSTGPIRGRPHR